MSRVHICLVIVLLFTLFSRSVFAHTILPPNLEEFIKTHPGSTTLEIQMWIDEQNTLLHGGISSNTTQIILEARNPQGVLKNIIAFISLGILHIFTGIDHILFLLAMMLAYKSFKDALKLTGTFTIAHSITLILAGTLYLSVSSRIVEPMIAFSIAFMAITTVFLRNKIFMQTSGRMTIIFLFGLFHGLGFAGALKDINVPRDFFIPSLLSFNVGIELGQLVIIFLIIPIIYFVRSTQWKNYIIQSIALLISAIGIWLGIQRLFIQ